MVKVGDVIAPRYNEDGSTALIPLEDDDRAYGSSVVRKGLRKRA